MQSFKVPRWYQELSIPQMQQVLALREVIKCDYQEHVSERTQKILRDIGITSTFVRIPSSKIKSLHKSAQLDPALFLSEIYRYITGNYFEDEGYKSVYDCNERLVLSAISFLKLPETINELHKRLPFRKDAKFPPKPLYPKVSVRKPAKSPYLEPLFERPDWRQYRKELQKWREKCSTIAKPQIILPPAYLLEKQEDLLENNLAKSYVKKKFKRDYQRKTSRDSKKNFKSNVLAPVPITENKLVDKEEKLEENEELEKSLTIDERLEDNRVSENKEDLLDDKKDHEKEVDNFEEIISISKVMIEDENIDKNVIIGSNKSKSVSNKNLYGRENLSLKWQEWFNDIDHDYRSLEKKANCMLTNVREVVRNIYNSDLCDDCCACRQVRKALIEKHTSKTPYLLLDSVVMDENDKTKMVGSLVLNSPPESLPDSWTNLPQIIPSQDKIIKKNIISGITVDEKGKINYLISSVVKETLHIPKKIKHLDPVIKNVPSCSCSQHELESNEKDKDEFHCSENGVCIAEKYKENKLSHCNKCSDDIAGNKIFRDFEKACKDRENREMRTLKPIDHQTCTQRFFVEEKKDVEKLEVQVPEVIHPLKKLMDDIDREKMLGKPKVSKKSQIKEYKDKIRFAISAIVENPNDKNNSDDEINNECLMEKYVLSEVTMQTPKTITPESSESDLSDISISPNRPHHHWSVTQFIPKPKPIETKPIVKPRFRFDVNKWREIIDQPFRKDIEELFEKVRQLNLSDQSFNDQEGKDSSRKNKIVNTKDSQVKKKYQRHRIRKVKKRNVAEPIEETNTEINHEEVQQLRTSREESRIEKEEMFYDFSKKSLTDLMKIALQKMAKEGFLLAKLPVCYNIPPLRMWIMYREGFLLTEKQKHDLLEKNEKMWNLIESKLQDKIVAPTITIKEQGHEVFNYDNIKKLQAEIELKKKLFYSKVRKSRVLKAREMWNQMEFEKFPNLAFKRAYFLYQPSKEADGHLKRPYGFNPSS
ncbi:uncharacterized protein ssp5 [Chelonus insularis]|uniref:uncharacterized protein ssp5 n=1 Tax=Chelonus insularis TaxID=460826 RepID=UPI00158EDBE9|nr:uncharacterized protein LOC118065708 [Chelonus insularis]XP_034937060.1 uncharacterized protein LOC118065708 [Chelonus insularis]